MMGSERASMYLVLFFWGHRRGRCQQFSLQFSLELFECGTDQGDSLSISGCRGYRSCVEGIFLKSRNTRSVACSKLPTPKLSRRRTDALCTHQIGGSAFTVPSLVLSAALLRQAKDICSFSAFSLFDRPTADFNIGARMPETY